MEPRREVPAKPRKIRVVCVSDTHNHAPGEGFTLPKGDILIHAGDLTNQGSRAELEKAARWLEKADFEAKVAVAGNHDLSLDRNYKLKHQEGWKVTAEAVEECRTLMRSIPGVTYLEHSSATVNLPGRGVSIHVFGSPYSVESLRQNWAFQYASKDGDAIWSEIPAVDILISHTPPQGHVDTSRHWTEGGCASLKQALRRIRPALHVCGHCHEGRGAEVICWSDRSEEADGVTVWEDPGAGNKKQSLLDLTHIDPTIRPSAATAVVNASIMAKSWGQGSKAFNKPIVVDLALPAYGAGS